MRGDFMDHFCMMELVDVSCVVLIYNSTVSVMSSIRPPMNRPSDFRVSLKEDDVAFRVWGSGTFGGLGLCLVPKCSRSPGSRLNRDARCAGNDVRAHFAKVELCVGSRIPDNHLAGRIRHKPPINPGTRSRPSAQQNRRTRTRRLIARGGERHLFGKGGTRMRPSARFIL